MLKIRFSQNLKSVEALLNSSIEWRKNCERFEVDSLIQLANIIQFIILVNYDMSCLLDDMCRKHSRLKRKIYTKHLILVMFEGTEDLKELLGKKVQDILKELNCSESMINQIRQLHKELHEFINKNYSFFRQVRNTVIAHREHNAQEQIELLNALNDFETIIVGGEFIELITKLNRFFQMVVDSINNDMINLKK